MKENLLLMKKILDELGIEFWLDGGTLLGVWHNGDFLKDDHDIDLSCWAKNWNKHEQIVIEAAKNGFECFEIYREPSKELRFRKDEKMLDIFFINKKKDDAWLCVYKFPGVIPVYKKTPARMFDKLDQINFKGEKFNIPSETQEYLEMKYGPWREGVRNWDCSKDDLSIVEKI